MTNLVSNIHADRETFVYVADCPDAETAQQLIRTASKYLILDYNIQVQPIMDIEGNTDFDWLVSINGKLQHNVLKQTEEKFHELTSKLGQLPATKVAGL